MDGVERGRRWKDLKQRLRFKGIGFCGSSWSVRSSDMSIRDVLEEEDDDDDEEEPIVGRIMGQMPSDRRPNPPNAGQIPVNLRTALAAERNQRHEGPTDGSKVRPLMSLMRLFEESDGVDGKNRKRPVNEEGDNDDELCCVCIERNKGAAFIPCGHTFCRVCSRELWLNRGCCPLCNRSIVEILDIF